MKEIKKPQKKILRNKEGYTLEITMEALTDLNSIETLTYMAVWNKCYDECMAWHKADKIKTLEGLKLIEMKDHKPSNYFAAKREYLPCVCRHTISIHIGRAEVKCPVCGNLPQSPLKVYSFGEFQSIELSPIFVDKFNQRIQEAIEKEKGE